MSVRQDFITFSVYSRKASLGESVLPFMGPAHNTENDAEHAL